MSILKKVKVYLNDDFNRLVLEKHIVPTTIYRKRDVKRFIVAPRTIWGNPNAKRAKHIKL